MTMPTNPGRQRGSVVITTAIALSLIVMLLAGSELGWRFYMKRELQKAADLAALAGTQSVRSGCPAAVQQALVNANGAGTADPARNMPLGLVLLAADVECGSWTRGGGFVVPASGTPNALRVRVVRSTPAMLPVYRGSRDIGASAVAALSDPYAVFTVGTKLVTVAGDSLLGRSLKGMGLELGGSLVGYDGLAALKVTPAALLQALNIPVAADIGVGQLNALLAANQIGLGQLLDATVTAAGQPGLLASNVTLLNSITAKLGGGTLTARLGSTGGTAQGVFAQIVAPENSAASALQVGVSALDLLTSAIGVATRQHFVNVNSLSLAGGTVTARTALIEAPAVGIGGVGTRAYTGQLRSYMSLKTADLPLVGGIVRLNLPLMIDAADGSATLAEMCTPALRTGTGQDRARFNLAASVLKVCIGKPGSNPANEASVFSTSASCETNLQPELLLSSTLLGANLASLNAKLQVDPLPVAGTVTLAEGGSATIGNDLLLGGTVRKITDALLATLLNDTLTRGATPTAAQRDAIAADLWGTPPCTTSACRKTRLAAAKARIDNGGTGLNGFAGTLVGDTLTAFNQMSGQLSVSNLLTGVGTLVNGLLGNVTGLLGNILGGLIGNSCTGGALFGQGTDAACKATLADSLKNSSGSGAAARPDALVAFTGFLLPLLQPLLDGLGEQLIKPMLQSVLGLNVGQLDLNLRTLQCQPAPMLVY